MKKITALLLILVTALTACNATTADNNSAEAPQANISAEQSAEQSEEIVDVSENGDDSIPFVASYFRIGFKAYPEKVEALVFNTADELSAYLDANKEGSYYCGNDKDIFTHCQKYDEEFFKENSLVFILYEEISGSIRHEVKSATHKDGKLFISIERIIPYTCTDDMANWHFVTEIGKEFVPENINDIDISVYDGKPAEEPKPTPATWAEIKFPLDETCLYYFDDNSKELVEFLAGLEDRFSADDLCRCYSPCTVDTDYGTYEINVSEGYVRSEKGQAILTDKQLEKLAELVEWAQARAHKSFEQLPYGIPKLWMNTWGTRIQTFSDTYTWNDSSDTRSSQGKKPLENKDYAPVVQRTEENLLLGFVSEPDQVTVTGWSADKWGDVTAEGKPIEVICSDNEYYIVPEDEPYIYEVTATWDFTISHGTVKYIFATD